MPVGPYVYRAVSLENWVKAEKAKAPAFRRRWRLKDNGEPREVWDDDGLSFGLSPAEACQGLTEHYGVLKLSVPRMQARGFEFDAPANGHVNVTNMPFYRAEDRELANSRASHMIECVVEYIPAGSVPASDADKDAIG